MAELTVRDGMPPPGDLPRGEFSCTRLADGSIRVDRADPRILISAPLLDAIALHRAITDGTEAFALNARLDPLGGCDLTYVGAVLKINGVNRQVVYRITDYVPSVNA